MSRRQLRMWVLIIAALALLTPVGIVAYIGIGFKYAGGMGSMDEARRLRPVVEAMPPPTATATNSKTGAVAIVFPSGEWVVGVAKSTHEMYAQLTGGGTVVLKDSRGRVRCFFGHVCGGGNIGQESPGVDVSLDALDAHLTKQFTEQVWP